MDKNEEELRKFFDKNYEYLKRLFDLLDEKQEALDMLGVKYMRLETATEKLVMRMDDPKMRDEFRRYAGYRKEKQDEKILPESEARATTAEGKEATQEKSDQVQAP